LDIDIYYIRNDGNTGVVNVGTSSYDYLGSMLLIMQFDTDPRVSVIFTGDQGIANQFSKAVYDPSGVHDNHFHVRIADPDGTGN